MGPKCMELQQHEFPIEFDLRRKIRFVKWMQAEVPRKEAIYEVNELVGHAKYMRFQCIGNGFASFLASHNF